MRKLFNIDFNSYKFSLLDSFNLDADFASLATKLTFTTAPSIIDWIEGVEGKSLQDSRQTKRYSGVIPSLFNISDFCFKPKYYPEYLNDRYVFFTKKEYPSLEAAQKNLPTTYYFYDNSFYKRVNLKIFEKLTDYGRFDRGFYYRKEINNKLAIKLCPNSKFHSLSVISEFVFPKIVIELDGIEYDLHFSSEPRFYLFLHGTFFSMFDFERSDYVFDQNRQVVSQTLKKNEPLIYTENEGESYIISNSFEKLDCFNKYIFMVLELYIHYLRFFEKWLPKDVDSNLNMK